MGGKTQLCGKLIKKPGMPEERPCLRKKGHRCKHTPDLVGLKNVFGYDEVLRRAPDYVRPSGGHITRWTVLDKFGNKIMVRAAHLFSGRSTGTRNPIGSNKGSKTNGKTSPEYNTISNHYQCVFNKKHRDHSSYKNMIFFDGWNPDKGGSFIIGAQWIRKKLKPKPSPDYEIHVLKTKKHPYGFFGPGGIKWRHKMDRHDQDVLDLIHEWPKKKLREFVQKEIQPLLKAA